MKSKLVHAWIQPTVTTSSDSNEGTSTVAVALQCHKIHQQYLSPGKLKRLLVFF